VYWFHGATGTGKSHAAFEIAASLGEEPYVCNEAVNGNWWWDGYDGEACVIADDFRKDFARFAQLLRFLDKNPFQVAFKGGYRQLLATTIIITCAYSPHELYCGINENIEQLIRRIDHIKEFTERYVAPVGGGGEEGVAVANRVGTPPPVGEGESQPAAAEEGEGGWDEDGLSDNEREERFVRQSVGGADGRGKEGAQQIRGSGQDPTPSSANGWGLAGLSYRPNGIWD